MVVSRTSASCEIVRRICCVPVRIFISLHTTPALHSLCISFAGGMPERAHSLQFEWPQLLVERISYQPQTKNKCRLQMADCSHQHTAFKPRASPLSVGEQMKQEGLTKPMMGKKYCVPGVGESISPLHGEYSVKPASMPPTQSGCHEAICSYICLVARNNVPLLICKLRRKPAGLGVCPHGDRSGILTI